MTGATAAAGGSGGAIETLVQGEPAAVRELARWLRGTLAADVADAADRQVHARRRAAVGWEGAGASAYYDAAGAAVLAVDDHAERVRRAAVVADDVADRLAALRRVMADVRDRAVVGGLTVAGTRVLRPVDLAVGPVPPGAGVRPGAGEQALFDVLAREVAEARAAHADWVERRMARAVADAEERADVDRVLAGLAGSGRPGAPGLPQPVAGGPAGLAGSLPPAPGPAASSAGSGDGGDGGGGGAHLAGPGAPGGPTGAAGVRRTGAGAAATTTAMTAVPAATTAVPVMVAVDGSHRDTPGTGEVRRVVVRTPWAADPDAGPDRCPGRGRGDGVLRTDLGAGAPRRERAG
ncbi:hypothetical protein GCM10009737_17320 [Nocardioides lentus]|uniref:DUF222 domain-containing protein n=1 Tax=Nocardioides lentus TaxID=338077 RepID=A0ABP5ALB5_9ACTN